MEKRKTVKLQVVQAKFGGCYPPRSLALVDDILLDLHHSSHHTLPDSIFVNWVLESFIYWFSCEGEGEDHDKTYVTCTSPIMHLICPPKFCIAIVFRFSWVLQPSLEKLKTMLVQNFGVQIRCIMGDVRVSYASKPCPVCHAQSFCHPVIIN